MIMSPKDRSRIRYFDMVRFHYKYCTESYLWNTVIDQDVMKFIGNKKTWPHDKLCEILHIGHLEWKKQRSE